MGLARVRVAEGGEESDICSGRLLLVNPSVAEGKPGRGFVHVADCDGEGFEAGAAQGVIGTDVNSVTALRLIVKAPRCQERVPLVIRRGSDTVPFLYE